MRKVNSKLVGAFVLGAIALFMAAVIVFGKGHFFRPTVAVVMYFTGSVKGLQAGSAITFRGVTVGQVNEIELQYDAKNGQMYIPVFAEIYGDVLNIIGESQADDSLLVGHGKLLKKFIEKGIRAQLSLPNFVTNQVNVTLDFFPDQPVTLVKPIPDRTIEIPTVPSPIQEVTATVENVFKRISELPLDQLVSDTRSLMQGADRLVNNPQLAEIIANTNQTMAEVKQAMRSIDAKIGPILNNADKMSGTAQATLIEAKQRLADAKETMERLDDTLSAAQTTMKRADVVANSTNALLAPGSPLTYELINTLKEVAITARSARALMQTFERDPNAILVGRPASQKGERQ
jgi:paraquat-inducible protein B